MSERTVYRVSSNLEHNKTTRRTWKKAMCRETPMNHRQKQAGEEEQPLRSSFPGQEQITNLFDQPTPPQPQPQPRPRPPPQQQHQQQQPVNMVAQTMPTATMDHRSYESQYFANKHFHPDASFMQFQQPQAYSTTAQVDAMAPLPFHPIPSPPAPAAPPGQNHCGIYSGSAYASLCPQQGHQGVSDFDADTSYVNYAGHQQYGYQNTMSSRMSSTQASAMEAPTFQHGGEKSSTFYQQSPSEFPHSSSENPNFFSAQDPSLQPTPMAHHQQQQQQHNLFLQHQQQMAQSQAYMQQRAVAQIGAKTPTSSATYSTFASTSTSAMMQPTTSGVPYSVSTVAPELDVQPPEPHKAAAAKSTKAAKVARKKKKRDPDRPKRPLSAYNIFFKDERAKMLAQQLARAEIGYADANRAPTGVGFEAMARTISQKWHQIDPESKAKYQALADKEKNKYSVEKEKYMQKKQKVLEKSRERLEAAVDEETMQQYLASGGLIGKKKAEP